MPLDRPGTDIDPATAYRVVHDLMNPLTAALGYARILADPGRALAPELRLEFSREIVANLERIGGDLPRLLGLPPQPPEEP